MTTHPAAMTRVQEGGFSLMELLVSVSILSLALGGLAGLLIQNSQINRTEQMLTEVQANARNTMSMVVQAMRSAGYDPKNTGFVPVTTDGAPTNTSNIIEVRADLNEDADTADADEDVTIRFTGNQVDWRKSASGSFVVVSDNICNDQNGDGTTELMFTPDATNPTHVTVKITACSATVDPRSGNFLRYTITSEVAIRKNL